MTPKEKAKELVKKFNCEHLGDRYILYQTVEESKRCALIAVDEILDITKRPTYNQDNWNEITGFRYDKFWQEVQNEINQL